MTYSNTCNIDVLECLKTQHTAAEQRMNDLRSALTQNLDTTALNNLIADINASEKISRTSPERSPISQKPKLATTPAGSINL